MGSGTIGLLVAAVALQFGAHRVILVDILASKLDFARSWLGVETFLADPTLSPEDDAARLLKRFNLEEPGIDTTGGRVDTLIECSGAASSINTGIHLLRPGGKYVQTGVGKAKIEFPIVAVSNKELMFRGCFGLTICWMNAIGRGMDIANTETEFKTCSSTNDAANVLQTGFYPAEAVPDRFMRPMIEK